MIRLLHPLMPFVTEELWQRLPNRSSLTNISSIMISKYPEPVDGWTQLDIEKDMEVMKDVIGGARSIRSDYNIANHIKAEFGFQSSTPELAHTIQMQNLDFCTLSKGLSLTYFPSDVETPKGWAIKVSWHAK